MNSSGCNATGEGSATDSFHDFVGLDADYVTYFATGAGREVDEVVDLLCAILASGNNVVTTSVGELIYPP